ncbi:MAG: carbohydrate ABC transporter permease, partial [Candidatus Margulisiibacteriota bacterium]
MKIPYYLQKRITDIIISIVMLAFLALTLLSIGWMVYSSLKDSTDIAIGKVGLRRAGIDILKIIPEKDKLLVLTADGGVNYYDTESLRKLDHFSYKTDASSFVVDAEYIWLASTNKRLIRIAKDNFMQSKKIDFNTTGIDLPKVGSTYINKIGRDIFVSLDYKNFNDVWQFDAASLAFVKKLRQAKKEYFPEAGQIDRKEFPGIDGEVVSEASYNGSIFMGTSGGRLYKVDAITKGIMNMAKMPRGHLLIRFHNYVDMWRNVNFGLYLRNSIIICGFTMVLAMIFSTLAAYALSRFRFPGSDLFSNAILATQMIPAIMYLIPIFIMFVKFTTLTGIAVKGTFPGMIMIYTAFFLPFSIWILRGFFAAIPRELEEAALIDGCSRFKVFIYVALPLAIPGIVATGIYIFLTAWDELMFAWVMTNAETQTIPVGIRLFVGNYQNRFDLMMAAAVVATIPVVVLFFLLQRHIVRGLTAGAV